MLPMRVVPKAVIAVLFILALGFSTSFSQSNQELEKAGQTQAEMVLIPGGEFVMGRDDEGDCSPAHRVFVDSFYMDKYEVTNAQYFDFCQETERRLPEFWGMEEFHSGPDFPNYPVVGISWSDAKAYAEWADKRLPTEAEWEYAARGGLIGKKYPNDDEVDSTKANYTQAKLGGTVAVGSFPPNAYGLHDMAGNVWEWVADYYDKDYYESSLYENPTGPEDGKFKVIRGGGWHSGPSCNTVYFRNALRFNWVDFAVGFRCVKPVRE
ncbi:MAG: formylglycine-generating enzyme family protein [Candidatus Zixiibacteriota bacterium]|nr:MAG: formylglycine-generating enzyme family protein [candidate division Zixibacteria bacterium]